MTAFIILIILAILCFIATRFMPRTVRVRDGHDGFKEIPALLRLWFHRATIGIASIAVLCLGLSCFTVVGTKNVAVLTTFGRPSGFLDNGLHLKWPWEVSHEISDAIQTDTYASDPEDQRKPQGGATSTCVHVRIERQATACVNVSIRWQIKDTGSEYLFRNYKTNEHIQDNVVLRDLQSAMNIAFATYDPLGIDQVTGNNTNPPLTQYADQITVKMRSEISEWIDVQSIIVPFLNYDDQTQQKVNQLLQQIALTRVAIQAKQTALAQAEANKALAASVSNDPNVLVSKCLDILKEAVDKNQPLPAGFSCFGPTGISVAVK